MSSIAAVLANECRWHVECCDVLLGLRLLPAKSVHVVVTSPPYWGLRNYDIPPSIWGGCRDCQHVWQENAVVDVRHAGRGSADPKRNKVARPIASHSDTCAHCGAWRGCFGDEPTIELYVAHSVEILMEIHRVLRDDGVCWWNVGDSYGNDSKWGGYTSGLHVDDLHGQTIGRKKARKSNQPDLTKLMIPHRVALAAQAAGWVVRQDVVWQKLSPMPESVGSTRWIRCRWKVGKDENNKTIWRECNGLTPKGKPCRRCHVRDGVRIYLQRAAWRCTTAHEYIFQLVKGEGYFGNAEAVKEKAVGDRPGNRVSGKLADVTGDNGKAARMSAQRVNFGPVAHRNPRSVWPLSHEPMKEKHFAPFPSFIPRRCILACTSDQGCCPDCGAGWAPIVEKKRTATRPGVRSKAYEGEILKEGSPYKTHRGDVCGNKDPKRHTTVTKTLGWLPTCGCMAAAGAEGAEPVGSPVPAIVLDTFSGSGTTGRVANALGRRFIGFEISPRYAELARERIVKPFTKRRPVPKHKRPMKDQQTLFE